MNLGVGCLLWAGLLGVVVFGGARYVNDEPWYLDTVDELFTQGLTVQFLRELPGPAGPLYTLVHALFEPLTGLRPPAVRLVNVGLLLVIITLLAICLHRRGSAQPWSAALGLLGIPMTWVVSGLALTEIPAMLFLVLGMLGVAVVCDRTVSSPRASAAVAALAGLSVGISTCGRQFYLLVLPAATVLMLAGRKHWLNVALFVACGAIPPGLLFLVWGGLVPYKTARVSEGLCFAHAVHNFGYAAVVALILAPRWYAARERLLVAALSATVVLNLIFGFVLWTPMSPFASRVFGENLLWVYERLAGGAMVGLAVAFVIMLFVHGWQNRRDVYWLFLATATALLLLSAAKVTHLFTSRYTVAAAPLMLLMVDPYATMSYNRMFRVLLGGALGSVALFSYLFW